MKKGIIILFVTLLFTVNVKAGVTTFLYEKSYGDCNIKITHDAAPGEAGTLKIRSRTKSNNSCPIQKQQLREVLHEGLVVYRKFGDDSVKPGGKEFKQADSIFLGRIINYPWISDFVLEEANKPGVWNKKTGRPTDRSSNKYVAHLISTREVLFYFDLALEQIGLGVSGVRCEKVLVNKDKLPFDAMCWLKISR